MTERELQKQCNALLRGCGIKFVHLGTLKKYDFLRGTKGYPDLIIFANKGVTFFIELKVD